MKSLKLSKKERKNQMEPTIGGGVGAYPWGTTLRFESEQIKKLGIGDLAAGTMVKVEAVGKITEVHTSDRDGSKKYESMEIQIQKIDVAEKGASDKKLRKEIGKEVFKR